MAKQIRARQGRGILLNPGDQYSPKLKGAGIAAGDFADKMSGEAGKAGNNFSPKIKGAGIAVKGFADKADGAAEKVNKTFSGPAGTLGGLGISTGALSAVNSVIN